MHHVHTSTTLLQYLNNHERYTGELRRVTPLNTKRADPGGRRNEFPLAGHFVWHHVRDRMSALSLMLHTDN